MTELVYYPRSVEEGEKRTWSPGGIREEIAAKRRAGPLGVLEAVRLGMALEAEERPKADLRRDQGRRRLFRRDPEERRLHEGDVRTIVGNAIGWGASKYHCASKVVEAAESDPSKFGDLLAFMEARGVNAAFAEMKARTKGEPKGSTVRHVLSRGCHHPRLERTAKGIISDLVGMCHAIETADDSLFEELPPQAGEWADEIGALLSKVRKFTRRLRK